jgi:hypothetical protein
MLGSMTQLARYGTAWFTGEWLRARNILKNELGEVLVVPLLPLVGEDLWGKTWWSSCAGMTTSRTPRWSC